MTIELDRVASRAAAHDAGLHEPGVGAASGLERSARLVPWARARDEWDRLEPTGAYARHIRDPWLLFLTLLLMLPGLLLAVPIALVNTFVQRSPRRAFYSQPRVGRRGRLFVLYKFRTMRDHEHDDHERVTRFGRFLRNTHLDELPQLFAVLTGDMCLIGPRPEMVAAEHWAAQHFPDYAERLVLKPGLTGLAQITQGYTDRGDLLAYSRKVEINLCYREQLGFILDCRILAGTVLWMLRARGWRHG